MLPIIDADFTQTEKEIDAEFQESGSVMDAGFGTFQTVGVPGKSAYEVAVEEGFEGSKEEWLESLKGDPGEPGSDATVTKENIEAALGYTPADAKAVEELDRGLDSEFGAVWQNFDDVAAEISNLDERLAQTSDLVNDFNGDIGALYNGQKEINDRLDEIENNPEGTEVTKESIEEALGYTPVSDDIYNEITRIDETIDEIRESSSNYVIEGGYETDDDGNVVSHSLVYDWEEVLYAHSCNRCLVCLMGDADDKYIQFTPSEFYLGDGYIVFTAVGENGNSYELGLNAAGQSWMMKVDTSGAGGGAVHWNDIEDRPFGEMPTGGDTLYWDGNTEGLLEVNGGYTKWYKVSNIVLTEGEIFCQNDAYDLLFDIVTKDGFQSSVEGLYMSSNDELGAMFGDIGAVGAYDDLVFCATTDNYEIPAFGATLPEKGIYFRFDVRSFYLLNCTKFPSTKLMDKKYLPMSDITAAVLSALPIYNGEVEEV
jgi:hypothetical protein